MTVAPGATGVVPRLQTLTQIPLQQKISLMLVLAVAIALGAGAWMWSSTPDYRVLHANLAEREGGAVIAALQQMNVPYKFIDGTLMVPATQLHEARMRLASQGLPRAGAAGFELMENQKLGASQFVEQINYQRALEGELARSIQALGGVQNARVHLALSRQSAFLRDQPRTSASVLVNLHPGRSLDAMQVAAIAHLISHSVPGLPAKNVSIVDQTGALLSGDESSGKRSLDPGQLKFQQEFEQTYLRRIESILAPIVGAGNVRAQVSAEIDFTETEQAEETYKPNQRSDATVRSQQTSESGAAGSAAAGGVPGALSNQAPGPASAPIAVAPGQPGSAVAATAPAAAAAGGRRDSTVNYEVDKSIRHTKQSMGRIKRLSVAVAVNHATSNDAKGKPVSKPLSEAQIAQLTELVHGAIGFNKERGDQVSVVNSPFKVAEPEKIPETPVWKNPDHIELAKNVGKHLLIGGLALYLLLGILRPAMRTLAQPPAVAVATGPAALVAEGGPAQLSAAGYDQTLHNAKQIAKQDPKIVANVVTQWVNGNE